MLKQSFIRGDEITYSKETSKVPSITTMFLLQIQATIIQLLTQLPSKSKFARNTTAIQKSTSFSLLEQKRRYLVLSVQFALFQCVHWFLLVILFLVDVVARFLNVEDEMAEITTSRHHYQQQEEEAKKIYGDSEPALPITTTTNQIKNNTSNSPALVSPSSPTHSPTPNFVVRQRKSSNNTDESRVRHIRSLSNNMIDQKKPISPQKLRRITAQREITVQNAVLPIQPKKHHHHHHSKKPPTISHSSSSSSTTTRTTDRPKMQKTMSLSTAQQHHNEV